MSISTSSINPATMQDRLSGRTHAGLAAAAIIGLGAANAVLNRLYTASGHPVDYATGQTSFNGAQVKGWYAEMQAAGTLDIYWITQLFDFVFILSVLAIGIFTATYLARVSRFVISRTAALTAAVVISTGAMFDAIENLISFTMLASPQGFPEWIAVPYSAMAVAKFACIGLGVSLLVGSIVASVVHVLWTVATRGFSQRPAAA